jgi:hypothetical protein
VWDVERTAVDLDLDRPVLLRVAVSVHECRACHHYFRAQPGFLRTDATYTRRVVDKAVASVYTDGMAVTRVSHRLARDFWVRPSEAMIRRWCHQYAAGLDFTGSYQAWVVEEFSGVLCVDEVYHDRLALLLAVDPAASDGDRLIGYQLVHGAVEQGEVERFLARLRAAGIQPEQVITDGSALYPTVLAKVWPMAVHQLCLFHETRPVTRAVLEVVKDVRAGLPDPPRVPRLRGRPRKQKPSTVDEAASSSTLDRGTCLATVQRLRREGMSIHGIMRQTGHSRNTIRRWLREAPNPSGPSDSAPAAELVGPPTRGPECAAAPPAENTAPPPAPWASWEQVREFRQHLADHRYLLVRRPEHLTADEGEQLAVLLGGPASGPLRVVRTFIEEWYALWWDDAGRRRAPEDAHRRFAAWQTVAPYRMLEPLRRAQDRIDAERFAKISAFLTHPGWEATNNGVERTGRQFRHRQAPHFYLRSDAAIDADLRAWAISRKTGHAEAGQMAQASRSARGRHPARLPRAATAA